LIMVVNSCGVSASEPKAEGAENEVATSSIEKSYHHGCSFNLNNEDNQTTGGFVGSTQIDDTLFLSVGAYLSIVTLDREGDKLNILIYERNGQGVPAADSSQMLLLSWAATHIGTPHLLAVAFHEGNQINVVCEHVSED
jgi:hypothetical protein